jgi:hypothetical protein
MPTRSSTIAEISYLLGTQSESEARLSSLNPDVFRDESLYEKHRGKLREQSFDQLRADWAGRLESTFEWNNPEMEIHQAIESLLPNND